MRDDINIHVELYSDDVRIALPGKKGKPLTAEDVQEIIKKIDERIAELRREL